MDPANPIGFLPICSMSCALTMKGIRTKVMRKDKNLISKYFGRIILALLVVEYDQFFVQDIVGSTIESHQVHARLKVPE